MAQANLQDQFAQLPHGKWRGITVAILERSVRFAHEGTDHQVIYRNGVAVEMTGAGARIISYTLAFREGVTRGPYAGLFSNILLAFWRAYHDNKSPGELYDPVYGALVCVPQEWDESTDIQKRDGVDVRVSFKEHSPIEGTSESAPATLDSLQSDAESLDAAVSRVTWPVQQPPPAATANPLAVASGLIQQGNFMVSRSKSRVHEVAMRMNEVEEAAAEAEKNGTPGAGLVRQDARRARLRALKVAEAPPRETVRAVMQVTYEAPRDIFAVASGAGMTIQEFLELNPGLSRSTIIPAYTPIWKRRKS